MRIRPTHAPGALVRTLENFLLLDADRRLIPMPSWPTWSDSYWPKGTPVLVLATKGARRCYVLLPGSVLGWTTKKMLTPLCSAPEGIEEL